MEAFEQRLLLAGDVLAEVTKGGDLVITGDDAANQIVITEGAAEGQIVITSGADATQINGDAGPITLEGFSRHVKIKMGDGDDVVVIKGDLGDDDAPGGIDGDADGAKFAIGGNVKIDMGTSDGASQNATLQLVAIDGNMKITNKDGDSRVDVNDVIVGSLSIANGKGKHDIDIVNTIIGKNLAIKNKQLNAGDDPQTIDIINTTIGAGVKISNGKGATTVNLINTQLVKNLIITSKDGDDSMILADVAAANIKVNFGKGVAELVSLELTATKSLAIKGGDNKASELTVLIIDMDAGKVSIQGSAGDDWIALDDITVESLQIKTGNGADLIELDSYNTVEDDLDNNPEIGDNIGQGSTAVTLKIFTGGGIDIVRGGLVDDDTRVFTVTGKSVLDGGGSTDVLNAGPDFINESVTVRNFEAGDSIV